LGLKLNRWIALMNLVDPELTALSPCCVELHSLPENSVYFLQETILARPYVRGVCYLACTTLLNCRVFEFCAVNIEMELQGVREQEQRVRVVLFVGVQVVFVEVSPCESLAVSGPIVPLQ